MILQNQLGFGHRRAVSQLIGDWRIVVAVSCDNLKLLGTRNNNLAHTEVTVSDNSQTIMCSKLELD